MIKKFDKSVGATLAPVSLAVSLTLVGVGAVNAGSHGGASFGPYLNDASGAVVTTGAGECWDTTGGIDMPMSQCDDVMPVKDADGDGVGDDNDKCPGTPRGVKVNASGCPLDSDADGVLDSADRCPGTPKGAKVDANGCVIPKAVPMAPAKTTLDRFEFDSAQLKNAMKAALDRVVGILESTPADESLEIVGHTDATGTDVYNQGLSERRAQSVADYLAGKGVSNMSIRGVGEGEPAGGNATRDGRASNRRVDISIK